MESLTDFFIISEALKITRLRSYWSALHVRSPSCLEQQCYKLVYYVVQSLCLLWSEWVHRFVLKWMMYSKMKQSEDKLQNMLDPQHFKKFPTNGLYRLHQLAISGCLCVIIQVSFKAVCKIESLKPCFGGTEYSTCTRICVRRVHAAVFNLQGGRYWGKRNIQQSVKTFYLYCSQHLIICNSRNV